MHHRDLRNACCRHARLVGKAAPAFHKDLRLVHQVGAATLHQVNHRQLVLQGHLLGAQRLLEAHGCNGAAFDRAVVHRDQAALARHGADADDGAAAQHCLFAVVVMHVEAGQAAQLQERRVAVQQSGHALTRQQLAALLKLFALAFRLGNHHVLQALHLGQQALHALGIGGKGIGARVDLGTQGRHRSGLSELLDALEARVTLTSTSCRIGVFTMPYVMLGHYHPPRSIRFTRHRRTQHVPRIRNPSHPRQSGRRQRP